MMTSTRMPRATWEQLEPENRPPWPEWSDIFINTVQWSKLTKRSINTAMFQDRRKSTISVGDAQLSFEDENYEDPAGLVLLPADLTISAWKRPSQVFPDAHLVIEPDDTPFDLVTHNKHLLDNKIMRMIICSITCIERESFYRPFHIESQSEHFTATAEVDWRPWHHVYAFTQAGKGHLHKPQYNPYGKYIIRLFYLGKWRRITVDDKLPIDDKGQVLLPMSRPNNLWLPLLTKALLRVAAISWQPNNPCVDFSVVHCLTGWIPTIVPCKGSIVYHLWCVCCQLMPTTHEVVHAPGCCRSNPLIEELKEDLPATGSRVIFALTSMFRSCDSKSTTYTPRGGALNTPEQLILICNARYNSEQPSPHWKQYRWNEWAFNKGIISEIPFQPVRNVQVYCPLEVRMECGQGPVYNEAWVDFNSVVSVLRELEVYYKPSYFKYSLCAWNVSELVSPPKVAEDSPQILKTWKRTLSREEGGGDSKRTSKSKSPKAGKAKSPKSSTAAEKFTKPPSKPGSGKDKGKAGKGRTSHDRSDEDWPYNILRPSLFYIFVDSMNYKDILVCLSAYDPERPTYAHIVIGDFKWHSPSVSPLIERISTTATSARFFTLHSGLRVFRIWYQFPTHFCMRFLSNVPFQTGTKMHIQKSLTVDSQAFQFYGKQISEKFTDLLEMPEGGPKHGQAFIQLMKSLDPPRLNGQLNWPQWFIVHIELEQAFEESLTEMLIETLQNPDELHQALMGLQLLFLNPGFGMKVLKCSRPEYYNYFVMKQRKSERIEPALNEQLTKRSSKTKDQKGKEKGAKRGKSADKSTVAKSSLKPATTKEKGGKKKHSTVKPMVEGEQLKKLLQCKEKSLLIGEPHQAATLLKKMLKKLPHLRHLYPFELEDDMKLVCHDYFGELHEEEKKWVVLAYCVVNTHSTEEVPCSLHVWSPVENLVLRLINNDNLQEIMPLGFVENCVAYLSRNMGGYTLIVYGVTTTYPTPWRLRSLGIEESDCLHICSREGCDITMRRQPPDLDRQTLVGYYIPNKKDTIASCVIEVTSDVTVLLRVELSYNYALCRVTITDEAGQLVVSSSGMGHVMFPILVLKGSGDTQRASIISNETQSVKQPNVYRLSVTLLERSWPLTPDQMRAMVYYKEHLPEFHSDAKRSTTSLRHSTFMNTKEEEDVEKKELAFFHNANKPSWTITLVSELQKESRALLRLDTSLQDEVDDLVAQWETEGFNLDQCKILRQDFLKKSSQEDVMTMSEDEVFHLLPRKLVQLNRLYGKRKVSDQLSEGLSVSNVSSTHPSTKSSSTQTTSKQLLRIPSLTGTAQYSIHSAKNSQTSKDSVKTLPEEKLDHTNVMVQQAGVHRALENMRRKNAELIQQTFKETADLRAELINRMKMAKETEGATNGKKGKESIKSGKKSIKSEKQSVKGSKSKK